MICSIIAEVGSIGMDATPLAVLSSASFDSAKQIGMMLGEGTFQSVSAYGRTPFHDIAPAEDSPASRVILFRFQTSETALKITTNYWVVKLVDAPSLLSRRTRSRLLDRVPVSVFRRSAIYERQRQFSSLSFCVSWDIVRSRDVPPAMRLRTCRSDGTRENSSVVCRNIVNGAVQGGFRVSGTQPSLLLFSAEIPWTGACRAIPCATSGFPARIQWNASRAKCSAILRELDRS